MEFCATPCTERRKIPQSLAGHASDRRRPEESRAPPCEMYRHNRHMKVNPRHYWNVTPFIGRKQARLLHNRPHSSVYHCKTFHPSFSAALSSRLQSGCAAQCVSRRYSATTRHIADTEATALIHHNLAFANSGQLTLKSARPSLYPTTTTPSIDHHPATAPPVTGHSQWVVRV